MLMKSTEFFKNLPTKKCHECGKDINEQHECYGNKCSECLSIEYTQN